MVRVQTDVIGLTPTLAIDSLTIASRRGTLVSSFSWRVSTGRVCWLIGENGTGKSSLLRTIAGWQRPQSGRVVWTGIASECVHYYSPSMFIPPDVRVRDWIDYAKTMVPSVPSSDRVDQVYPQSAGLARRFGDLSTGESKRLMLWALLRPQEGPIIFDEPYEHLSRDAKRSMTDILRQIARKSIVIVATNQDIPMISGEQLLVLDGSRIEVEENSDA